MGRHVVVGAGAVGRATADALVDRGHHVVVVTRRGAGSEDGRVESVAADASDPIALSMLVDGADALYNCANPAYHRWAKDWPPLADSLLAAATKSGAVLVAMSNLYGYGPVDHPMTTADPLAATFTNGRIRAEMWQRAKAAHDAGRARVTEARASDFFGPGTEKTSHLSRALPRLLAGRSVRVLGDPDQPHSWSYIPDVGATMCALGTTEAAWGSAWHVPTNPPATQRWMLERVSDLAGLGTPKVSQIPNWLTRTLSLAWPTLRELRAVSYQFDAPFVIDASATEAAFAIAPTPIDDALSATVTAARASAADRSTVVGR